jgi:hypothetical protein
MNWSFCWRWVAVRIVTLCIPLLLTFLLIPSVVHAEGGLALSGSFYNQDFVIPQGASVSGPSIGVVVFNNGSEAINIRMLSQAPTGVTLRFSSQQFIIPPGGQQQVLIGITVAADVAPGSYDLSVTAQSYKEGGAGIQVAGAAGQTARVSVTGDSAQVELQALSPDGQPLVATVRLFHIVNGQNQEVAFSEKGKLKATVAPGDFKAASYIVGQQMAEQTFTLAKGDNKTIDLTGATIYFAAFGVLPAYARDSGRLAFAQIVYTVKNIYQPVNKGDVILQTTFNGIPQAPLTLLTLSPLAIGSSGLNYNYTPTDGWLNGSYDFQLQLKLEGKLYTSSKVENLDVSTGETKAAGMSPTTSSSGNSPMSGNKGTSPAASNTGSSTNKPQGLNSFLFIGIIAVVVMVATILVFWSRRKK